MVEFGNNLDPDEELDVLQNILDFPMECLEEDEDADDWDINNPQCLGPIPSNVLMGLSMMSDETFSSRSPSLFLRPVDPIPPKRKFAKVQESGSFCTQSSISVLESSGSCPREKSLSIKSDNAIPLRSRSKRARYVGINPWLLAAHGLSTLKQTPNSRRSKESRKILFQQPATMDLVENSPRNVASSLDVSDPAHLKITSKPCHVLVKRCAHCQTSKTPLWRWGPLGRNTLCNACGVRFRSGRLFPEYRPAASPTFVPSLHSNSLGKVDEIRNKEKQLSIKHKIRIVRAPEQMHIGTSSSLVPPQIVEAPEQEQLIKHTDNIVRVPERKQLAKHVDTSCSLTPPQTAGVPEHKQVAVHVDTSSSLFPPQIDGADSLQIAGPPKQKQLVKHVGTSSSLISSQIPGAPEQKQLAKHVDTCGSLPEQMQLTKHVDTSSSFIPPPIAGAPKRKWLAKYCGTCSSHIPLQNKSTIVQESGALCTENHVSLLESSGSSLREKSPSIMSSRSICIKPVKAKTRILTVKKSRKKSSHLPAAMEVLKNSPKNDDESSLDVSDTGRMQNASEPCPAVVKKCAHCESTETPQWRNGPLGPRTLCNACGVRHPDRPAASPTFMPYQHSNFRSKVLKMRIKAKRSTAESKGRTYISEARS